MKELDDNKFLLELGKLYQAQDDKKGTVWLEFKRYEGYGKKKLDPVCLIHAHTAKKKSKISTKIAYAQLEGFQKRLGAVLKLHFDNLPKQEKDDMQKKKLAEKKSAQKKAAVEKDAS